MIFVSWAPYCSRSDGIAAQLGGKSYLIYSPFWGSRFSTILLKYFVQGCRTLWVLLRDRPRVVFVMAPPVVACLPVWLYCCLARANFVIDAHTGAFDDPRWRRLQFLQRFFSRRAVTTIVTNRHLASIVEQGGGQASIVTDVPVCFSDPEPANLSGDCNMTLVSSFCGDEPIEDFLQAVKRFPKIRFHITGDCRELSSAILESAPANVRFTGFLNDSQFVGLLLESDAVIALTTRNHTMQRAAYEAVYLERPVITSDFPVLQECFPKGTVHVRPTAAEIADGIARMHDGLERYTREVAQLRQQKLRQWEIVAARLRHLTGLESAHGREKDVVRDECAMSE